MSGQLAKQTAEDARKLLARTKIDAPFVECPDCFDLVKKAGRGYYYEDNVSFVCETCTGTGRLYFKRSVDAPIFTQTERGLLIALAVVIVAFGIVCGAFLPWPIH